MQTGLFVMFSALLIEITTPESLRSRERYDSLFVIVSSSEFLNAEKELVSRPHLDTSRSKFGTLDVTQLDTILFINS